MEDIIKQSCSDTADIGDIEKGRYHLVAAEGQIILPSLWDKLVAPGLEVKLSIWQKAGQDEIWYAAKAETSLDKKETWMGMGETGLDKEEALEREAPISFKDGAGRMFSIPWHRARSWTVSRSLHTALTYPTRSAVAQGRRTDRQTD